MLPELLEGGWGAAAETQAGGSQPPSTCSVHARAGGRPGGPSLLTSLLSPWQVSCLGDQAHLVLSGQGRELRLTVRERGQRSTTHPLGALRSPSCAPATRQRLLYALHMLQSV